jgi:hypothetical protein
VLPTAAEALSDAEPSTVELPIVAPLPVSDDADETAGRTAATAAQADPPTVALPVVTRDAEAVDAVSGSDGPDGPDGPATTVLDVVTPDDEPDGATGAVSDLGRAALG